jgi:hypothetical protein
MEGAAVRPHGRTDGTPHQRAGRPLLGADGAGLPRTNCLGPQACPASRPNSPGVCRGVGWCGVPLKPWAGTRVCLGVYVESAVGVHGGCRHVKAARAAPHALRCYPVGENSATAIKIRSPEVLGLTGWCVAGATHLSVPKAGCVPSLFRSYRTRRSWCRIVGQQRGPRPDRR